MKVLRIKVLRIKVLRIKRFPIKFLPINGFQENCHEKSFWLLLRLFFRPLPAVLLLPGGRREEDANRRDG